MNARTLSMVAIAGTVLLLAAAWLRWLPPLVPTKVVDKGEFYISPSGKKLPKWYSDNKNGKFRSQTFPGIADAMASQWG